MNTETLITGLAARPWVHGWELTRAIETLLAALSAKVSRPGKTLRPRATWTNSVPTAAINSAGEVHLASVAHDAKVDRRTFVRYVGFVIHEVLHFVYTDFSARGSGKYLDALHNAVEDAWIEMRGMQDGVTGNIARVMGSLIDMMVEESLDAVQDWTDPRQYPWVLAVICRPHATRKVPVADGLAPIFAEAAQRTTQCKSSHDTLAVAQWVLAQLKALDEQGNEKGNEKGQEKGNEKAEEQGGESTEGQPGEKAEESEGAEGEGEGEGAEGGKSPGRARSVGSENDDAANPEPRLKVPRNQRGVDFDQDHLGPANSHQFGGANDLTVTVPARLRYEVRRIFDNSGSTMFTQGRKSGSIHSGSLHKATLTDRVFQRRQDTEGIDSACMIVVDCSGSMGGARMDAARKTAWALAESLLSAEVKVGVTAFCSDVSIPAEVGSNKAHLRTVISKLNGGGGTRDSAALRVALDRMLPRPESRKVIFVLTDGQGFPEGVKALCKSAHNLGVTVVGVGIQCSVDGVYTQSVMVRDISALGETVFKQIKLAA